MQGISRIALLSALATSLTTTAYARDTDDIALKQITVTASSQPVDLGRTGTSVDVVTQEDLRKTADQSLATVLARLPGVSITNTGGLGKQTTIRLRGLPASYIGVRIDGIDVSDTSSPATSHDFNYTMTGGISRVEVLRGSQSARFGSEAIAGVIDITSFRASEEGTEAQLSVEAGSYGTYSGTAAVGMKTDRVDLAFTASRIVTDGFSAFSGGTEDDGFRSTSLSFYGSYAATDSLTLGLNGIARDSVNEFDTQTADAANVEDGKLRGLRAFATFETGATTHDISFARTETERVYSFGFYDGTRDQLAYSGQWDASAQLSLNWGLDETRESMVTSFDRGASTTRSVFGEAMYAPTDDLDLSLALRYDDHSVFGGKTTGRLAMAWRPTADWIVRGVASTGFRAPSLSELYGFGGNLALKPEESRSFELGAEYLLPNDGSLQMTLFDTEIDNKISFVGGVNTQVTDVTKTRGVEIVGSTPIAEGWQMFGNYTYTDAYTDAAGVRTAAIRVPRHDITLGVEADLANGWGGVFTIQHVADFTDSGPFPAGISPMSDYTVAHVSVSYDITDQTQAYVRVENIFDETYETIRNYSQPDRSIYLGVQAKF